MKNNFIYGKENQKLFKIAKERKFAMPAVNVSGSNTINSVLETASEINSPVIIQFSNGGSQFIAGKGMSNQNFKASISGSVAGAGAAAVGAESAAGVGAGAGIGSGT